MTRRALVAGAAGVAAAALPAVPASAAAPLLPGARLKPDRALSVAVPGGRVYVRVNGDLGNGKPPIVMLHGGPGSENRYLRSE